MSSGKLHHSAKVATTFPLQEEVEDGKNRHLVKCQRCPSKILNPGMGVYKQVEVTAVVRQWYNNTVFHLIICVSFMEWRKTIASGVLCDAVHCLHQCCL